MSVDQVGRTRSRTVSEEQIIEYGHGDEIENREYVAVTEEGIYSVPGNASVQDVLDVLDADEGYVRQFRDDDSAKTSASAQGVGEVQLEELMRFVNSPFSILNGKIQRREGQSTDSVTEYPPVDQI